MLRMNRQDGIEVSGEFSPFIRACIGVRIVMFFSTPFILAVGKVLHWLRWW